MVLLACNISLLHHLRMDWPACLDLLLACLTMLPTAMLLHLFNMAIYPRAVVAL
jgi:hypothetical protein